MSTTDEFAEFGFLLHDIGRLMRRRAKERLAQLGMTDAQWRAMFYLTRAEGCRLTDLADALQVRPMTLVRIIDKLEESGLVSRRPHPTDRRAQTLHLTDKSRKVVGSLETCRDEVLMEALSTLGLAQRRQLMSLLETVKSNLLDVEATTGSIGRVGGEH